MTHTPKVAKDTTVYFQALFIALIASLVYGMLRSFLPIFAGELDPSGFLVGFSISSYSLGRTVFGLPSGLISSKIGMRIPILFGLSLATIAPFICASSMSIYVLISGLTLWGLGAALIFTTITALIVGFFEPNARGSALGKLLAIEVIGISVGSPIGGFVAEYLSYNFVFCIAGALVAACFFMALMSKGLKKVRVLSREKSEHTTVKGALDNLKNRGLLVVCAGAMSISFVNHGVIYAVFVIYLHDFLKMSVGLGGVILGVRTLAFCLASVSSGRIYNHVGRKRVVFVAIFTECLCLCLYTLMQSFEFILILAFVEGLGWGMISVTLIMLMSEQVAPGHSATAVGLYNTFADVGAVIGPIIMMIILTTFNVYACFLFGAALLLANILTILTIKESAIEIKR